MHALCVCVCIYIYSHVEVQMFLSNILQHPSARIRSSTASKLNTLGARASVAGPVTRVHVDYNEVSAPKRLQQLAERPGYTGVQLPADAEKVPGGKVCCSKDGFLCHLPYLLKVPSLVMSCVHFDVVFLCHESCWMTLWGISAPCKVLGSGQRFAFINVWRSIVACRFSMRAAAVFSVDSEIWGDVSCWYRLPITW